MSNVPWGKYVATNTRVVGFEKSDLDSLLVEVSLGLGKVQRGVVRRSMPKVLLKPFY